jgi:hypothetical protein
MRDCGSRWPNTASMLHERLLACRKAGAAAALQVNTRIEQQVVHGRQHRAAGEKNDGSVGAEDGAAKRPGGRRCDVTEMPREGRCDPGCVLCCRHTRSKRNWLQQVVPLVDSQQWSRACSTEAGNPLAERSRVGSQQHLARRCDVVAAPKEVAAVVSVVKAFGKLESCDVSRL